MKGYWDNIVLIVFAFLFAPLFYGLFLIKKFRKNKAKKSFLVIQTAKIGDLVCTTSVFREIKRKYPDSFLTVLVIPIAKDILKNNPYVDEVILFDKKKYKGVKGILKLSRETTRKRFDWSFSLVPGAMNSLVPFWAGIPNRVITVSKYASRSEKIFSIFNNHYLEYHKNTLALRHYLNLLKFIGISSVNEKKELYTGLEEKTKADQFIQEQGLNKEDILIGISITAGKEFKEWAPEKFAQLADLAINEFKAKVLFVGSSDDRELIKHVQSLMKNKSFKATQFNLNELAAFLKKLSLFIGVDTGPLYIADAVETPVVNIAGPCAMESQCPSGKAVIIQKPTACRFWPCSFIMSAPSFCREGHLNCLKTISADDVFQAVKRLLNQ